MELPMLLLTINCSIGNEANHLTIDDLCDLFLNIKEKECKLSTLEKYAICTMQDEALPQEFEFFKQKYNIPQENIRNYVANAQDFFAEFS